MVAPFLVWPSGGWGSGWVGGGSGWVGGGSGLVGGGSGWVGGGSGLVGGWGVWPSRWGGGVWPGGQGEVTFQSVDRCTHECCWFLSRHRHQDGRLRDHQQHAKSNNCHKCSRHLEPADSGGQISILDNGAVRFTCSQNRDHFGLSLSLANLERSHETCQ